MPTERVLHKRWWWDYHTGPDGKLNIGMEEGGHPNFHFLFMVEKPEGDHGEIQSVLTRIANEHNAFPALEAVAEAARELSEEWKRLGYWGPLTTKLRAAFAKLEGKG